MGPLRRDQCAFDSRDQVLQCKTVRLVRVLWRHYGVGARGHNAGHQSFLV